MTDGAESPPALPNPRGTSLSSNETALDLAFPALLRGLTQKEDVSAVQALCETIVGNGAYGSWEPLLKAFFDEVVRTRDALPARVLRMEAELSPDWFRDPWYLIYVNRFGVEGAEGEEASEGRFADLERMLPYVRDFLGFRNICLLPHYESPMGDGGYDVSAYVARGALGGEKAFEGFMARAVEQGMRVMTDAVFNHTSTEHEWFQRALDGDEKYLAYYLQRNGREKIGEWDRGGDIVCRYRDPDGTITERVVVFPDVDRTHGLWVEINGRTYQFYREFLPFQIDLNLQNPDVLVEVLAVLGREVRQGILGKRADAAAHWVKKPGCAAEGLPESHAVQALLKTFLRHVNKRSVLMPEVVVNMRSAAEYAGVEVTVNRDRCSSEGDAIMSFEMQAALREMTYLQTVAPYWRRVFLMPALPKGSVWINLLEHHDETYMGFFLPEVRHWLCDYIASHKGRVYKNGMSAGGRFADCLNEHPQRIATALFVLYITPGTPLVYAGTEVGAISDEIHAQRQAAKSHDIYQALGVYAPLEACYDPRELQRGPLRRELFVDAEAGKNAITNMVRKLNTLRHHADWLGSEEVRPLDSGDVGILCMGRRGGSASVVCIANLTAAAVTAVIPVGQLTEQLGIGTLWRSCNGAWKGSIRFVDILTDQNMMVEADETKFYFKLAGFGRAVVKAMEME